MIAKLEFLDDAVSKLLESRTGPLLDTAWLETAIEEPPADAREAAERVRFIAT